MTCWAVRIVCCGRRLSTTTTMTIGIGVLISAILILTRFMIIAARCQSKCDSADDSCKNLLHIKFLSLVFLAKARGSVNGCGWPPLPCLERADNSFIINVNWSYPFRPFWFLISTLTIYTTKSVPNSIGGRKIFKKIMFTRWHALWCSFGITSFGKTHLDGLPHFTIVYQFGKTLLRFGLSLRQHIQNNVIQKV